MGGDLLDGDSSLQGNSPKTHNLGRSDSHFLNNQWQLSALRQKSETAFGAQTLLIDMTHCLLERPGLLRQCRNYQWQ
jgi:hypothetical protein